VSAVLLPSVIALLSTADTAVAHGSFGFSGPPNVSRTPAGENKEVDAIDGSFHNEGAMRPTEILAQLRRRPFVPIRVFMSDGSSYDVRHPEMMVVTQTVVAIGMNPGEDDLPERLAYCDPIHVVRIDPIDGKNKMFAGGSAIGRLIAVLVAMTLAYVLANPGGVNSIAGTEIL